ncbi:GRHPR-like protein, partial [Mya arenaria]
MNKAGERTTESFCKSKNPDGAGLAQLQVSCDLMFCDEEEEGQIAAALDRPLRDVVGASALIVDPDTTVDAEVLNAAGPQLKVIATMSVGLDHIDLKECARRNIAVGYTPDVHSDAVAEATIALTLATARRYKEGIRAVSSGVWGSAVEGMLYLRSPKDYAGDVDAEYVSFGKLLEHSDIVIACCSINQSNHKLFNATAFQNMKNTAIFVNMSRGLLVDQDALFDVTSPEPLPPDHRFLKFANCLILSHIGSATVMARHAIVDLAVKNTLAGCAGAAPNTSHDT